MKLILTHKKQLLTAGDVSRFIKYCYGKDGSRPVVPVEGYMPGLPAGAPALDGEALLSGHHGGKAAKARSIAFSSEYFPTREEALAHAPAMPQVCSAYRTNWAPQSNAISIVHLSEGQKQWEGMWRLDAHLIIANSDGRRGLQWSREQCKEMQDFRWLPGTIKDSFSIVSGKGAGVTRRTQKIPYPKAQYLIAHEIGKLSDNDIEEALSNGIYGAARRRKDGSIISLEASGKRINLARARELARVRDGTGTGAGVLPSRGPETSPDTSRGAGPGHDPDAALSVPASGFDHVVGDGGQGGKEGSACAHTIRRRRRRVSGRSTPDSGRQIGFTSLCPTMRRGTTTALAAQGQTGAILRLAGDRISNAAAVLESIEIFRL